MMEYTKQVDNDHEIGKSIDANSSGKSNELNPVSASDSNESGEKEVSSRTYEDAPPLILTQHPNISQDNVDSLIKAERQKNQVRELTAPESGRELKDIPAGTYFFTMGFWIPLYTANTKQFNLNDNKKRFNRLECQRYQGYLYNTEVHYPRDKEPMIIFYFNEASAYEISQLSGEVNHEFTAAFAPWKEYSTMIAIPISRILNASKRTLQYSVDTTIGVLDLVVR